MAIAALVGKWFVFWSVGVRLFLAGLQQSLRLQFTAHKILAIYGADSLQIVQELGFANLGLGLIGILTILQEDWVLPSAIAGCVFLRDEKWLESALGGSTGEMDKSLRCG